MRLSRLSAGAMRSRKPVLLVLASRLRRRAQQNYAGVGCRAVREVQHDLDTGSDIRAIPERGAFGAFFARGF